MIKTEFTYGYNNQVKKGTLSSSPGTQDGELSWNTKGESTGKNFLFINQMHLLT